MLIDDAKGALAALKAELQEDRRIKSGTDLNVGDIFFRTWTATTAWYSTRATMIG